MITVRIIPKLEVKGNNLIKGIHLEGLRVVGKPEEAALKYARQGADELIYIDLVASLYGRANLLEIVSKTAKQIYIPLTVGGGIRTTKDVALFLRAGADKVAINTAITLKPKLITEVANKFGSQCMVASLEVQRKLDGSWEVLADCGRTSTKLNPITWAQQAVKLGAGEILLTAIHQDGTKLGYDLELIKQIATKVSVPVIASGGAGKLTDFKMAVKQGKADALATATMLHFNQTTILKIKKYLKQENISVRL